jgi:hypothetical protein
VSVVAGRMRAPRYRRGPSARPSVTGVVTPRPARRPSSSS